MPMASTSPASQPVPPGSSGDAEPPKAKSATPTPQQQQQQQQQAPPGEKKLSNAELKKKAKEEKAARRAAAKGLQPAAAAAVQNPQQNPPAKAVAAAAAAASADASGKSPKSKSSKHDAHAQQPAASRSSASASHNATAATAAAAAGVEAKGPQIPYRFSHLSMARRIPMTQADKDVHPAVLALGQHMSTFSVTDSIARLEMTLLAFKKVIDAYTTPHGATFSRHLTSHVLGPQIDYLTASRPMSFSMGNAIRWLKLQISKVDIDLPDAEARQMLSQAIDNFIRDRVMLAHLIIARTAATAAIINHGDVVVTYARHPLVERALVQAAAAGRHFRVIIIDDPEEPVGMGLAATLSGIPVTYAPDLSAVRASLADASVMLLGAEAVFGNGALYARAGTSDVAAAAAENSGTRVVALCESINFTERVATDSLTYNEIDSERCTEPDLRLLFDTTLPRHVSVIITELGDTTPTCVQAILRKLEEL